MSRPPKSHPSPNFDDRLLEASIKYLIYHYAEGSLEESLDWLTGENPLGQRVSCHYLIAENGEVYALVPEPKRAWHAGVSAWENDENLNATSIGIELVNNGRTPYKAAQMESLLGLSQDIIRRHDISPWHVLGHSDIAPGRKTDPGPHFNWAWLAENGVGVYPPTLSPVSCQINDLQKALKAYGYALEITGELDDQTQAVLGAFQMHFGGGELDGLMAKLQYLLDVKNRLDEKAKAI